MFILTEAYAALIYINKMGYISKVTMYSTLNGFYVVLLVMIFQGASRFDVLFATLVTMT